MKAFKDNNYLLTSDLAIKLYNDYAKIMPIIDYHCHLNPKEIYENKPFETITKAWLVDGHYGDHYKWRSMRANGVEEEYITGSKTDEEKFIKWAETVEYTIGNPLYTWTHQELKDYFNITEALNKDNAKEIYAKTNEILKTLTPRKMIELNNVKVLCTTDDPVDDLKYHKLIKEDKSFKTQVLPAFRPDKAINIELSWFNEWVDKLEGVVGYKFESIDDFTKALSSRIDFFESMGARVSDHALDEVVYEEFTKEEVNEAFKTRRSGKEISKDLVDKYKTFMMIFFGKEYSKHSWVMQLHINAMRNNSERMLKEIGPDTGFDAINHGTYISSLSKLFRKLDETNDLPKTILYSLNDNDNMSLLALMGCFQGGVKGKMQLGSAWWFNDQRKGIKKQLEDLSSMGLISNFVGMLTDSRSFLSYPRHDYFRRILCSFMADLVNEGLYPLNIEFIGKVISDICYNNAKEYFKF